MLLVIAVATYEVESIRPSRLGLDIALGRGRHSARRVIEIFGRNLG